MDERVRFCVVYEGGEMTMSELCRQFQVSRKTGYEVLARWRAGDAAALAARSHAPHHCPHGLDDERRAAVLGVRHRYPSWGPKKMRAWLALNMPGLRLPAASTIGELFAREGLSVPRKRRRHASASPSPLAGCAAANDVWSMDFKGWFVTGDGKRCEPLTVQDQASRYLIRAVAVDRTDAAHVWPVLDAAFREFGLPARSAPTMVRPLPRRGPAGCRRWRCG
jgi:transposase